MRTPIQLFILGILCILAFPALFYEIPLRNKIRNGEIEYPPTNPEVTIPPNVRFIRTRGVHLSLEVDSTEGSGYTANNHFLIQVVGDTLIIEDSSKINQPMVKGNRDEDYDGDSWPSITIQLSGFNGWSGINSNLNLDFHTYQKGSTYSIHSTYGNRLFVNLYTKDSNSTWVESSNPFDADFQVQLDHLNDDYYHNIHSRNASFKLNHSNLEFDRNDFAKSNVVEADDSSEVVLPHRMIPKVNVKYTK